MSLKRSVLLTVTGACAFATIPSVAVASPEEPVTVEVTTVTEEQIESAARKPETAQDRKVAEEAKDDYLDDQARSGRLVDEHSVTTAVVEDATIVWDEGVNVESLTISESVDSDGQEGDAEVSFETGLEDVEPIDSVVATGLGLDVTSGLRGGTRVSGNCVFVNVRGDTANTCFVKYKAKYTSSRYNYYYYERWVTATGRAKTAAYAAFTPAIIDLRSRPWKGSAVTNTKQLNDYWPRGGSVGCKEQGTVSYTSAGMTMSVPLQDCDSTTPIPNATTKTMGVIYDQGSWVNGRSKAASFGMTVALTKGNMAYMADYTYVKFCRPYLCMAQSGLINKDSGW